MLHHCEDVRWSLDYISRQSRVFPHPWAFQSNLGLELRYSWSGGMHPTVLEISGEACRNRVTSDEGTCMLPGLHEWPGI